MDPFALFQLPPQFDLCVDELEKAYEKSLKLHPDAWGSVLFKQEVQKIFLRLNEAYEILKDPLRRARWLLEQKGAWPVAVFPQTLEEILSLETMDGTLRKQAYQSTYQRMAQAFKQEDWPEAQKAYWILKHLS